MYEKPLISFVPLLYDDSARVRLAAIEQLGRPNENFELAGLLYLLAVAVGEYDDAVAGTAARTRVRLNKAGGRGLPYLARNTQSPVLEAALVDDALSAKQIRDSAAGILRPVLNALHDMVSEQTNADMAKGAARVLGRFAFDESFELLLSAAEVETTAVEAVGAIANYGDPDTVFFFDRMLSTRDDENIRARAVKGISRCQGADAFDILKRLVLDTGKTVRSAVAYGLGERPEKEAAGLLLTLFADNSPEVVVTAVDSIVSHSSTLAVKDLIRLTEPRNPSSVRRAAIRALGTTGDDAVPGRLFDLLEDFDHDIVSEAVISLRSFDLPAHDLLKRVGPLVSSDDVELRAGALLCILPSDKDLALTTLRNLLTSSKRDHRRAGAAVAGDVDSVEAVKWLVTLINTEMDHGILSAALDSLQKLDIPQARDGIKRLLKHNNVEIRSQALVAFSNVADSSEIGLFEDVAKLETDEKVRAATVMAMGNMCDPANYLPITRALNDKDRYVVTCAVTALDRLGSRETATFLSPLLAHNSDRVRAGVIAALWKLGETGVVPNLEELLKERTNTAKESAFLSLTMIADSLHPSLMAERSFLLDELKRSYSPATASNASVAGIMLAYKDRYGPHKEKKPDQSRKRGQKRIRKKDKHSGPGFSSKQDETRKEDTLAELLYQRALGSTENFLEAMKAHLKKESRDAYGLYLAVKHSMAQEAEADTAPDVLRKTWKEKSFLPGLSALIYRAKRKNRNHAFLENTLTLLETSHRIYGGLLQRARKYLETGDDEVLQLWIKFLMERLPQQSDLHRQLADLSFEVQEPELAFEHYLRSYVKDEDDHTAALRACGLAYKFGENQLADKLAEILSKSDDVSEEIRKKVGEIKKAVAKGKNLSSIDF